MGQTSTRYRLRLSACAADGEYVVEVCVPAGSERPAMALPVTITAIGQDGVETQAEAEMLPV
jgi:hypothetical protein